MRCRYSSDVNLKDWFVCHYGVIHHNRNAYEHSNWTATPTTTLSSPSTTSAARKKNDIAIIRITTKTTPPAATTIPVTPPPPITTTTICLRCPSHHYTLIIERNDSNTASNTIITCKQTSTSKTTPQPLSPPTAATNIKTTRTAACRFFDLRIETYARYKCTCSPILWPTCTCEKFVYVLPLNKTYQRTLKRLLTRLTTAFFFQTRCFAYFNFFVRSISCLCIQLQSFIHVLVHYPYT